jgi:hypothetical protein
MAGYTVIFPAMPLLYNQRITHKEATGDVMDADDGLEGGLYLLSTDR